MNLISQQRAQEFVRCNIEIIKLKKIKIIIIRIILNYPKVLTIIQN